MTREDQLKAAFTESYDEAHAKQSALREAFNESFIEEFSKEAWGNESTWDKLKGGAGDAWDTIQDAGGDAMDYAKDQYGNAVDYAQENGPEAIRAMREGAGRLGNQAVAGARRGVGRTGDSLKAMYQGIKNPGAMDERSQAMDAAANSAAEVSQQQLGNDSRDGIPSSLGWARNLASGTTAAERNRPMNMEAVNQARMDAANDASLARRTGNAADRGVEMAGNAYDRAGEMAGNAYDASKPALNRAGNMAAYGAGRVRDTLRDTAYAGRDMMKAPFQDAPPAFDTYGGTENYQPGQPPMRRAAPQSPAPAEPTWEALGN